MKRLLLTLACTLLVGSIQSRAAMNAHLHIKSQSGAVISCKLQNFSCATNPREFASGLPTGKRMHKPFVFTKEIDRASALLPYILQRNETDLEVTVIFRKAGGEQAKVILKLQLKNAAIISIKQMDKNGIVVTENGNATAKGGIPMTEEISLLFQKIEWEQAYNKAMTSATWEAALQ